MMSTTNSTPSTKRYPSGITVLWSETASTASMCEALIAIARQQALAHVFIWFSTQRHDAAEIVERLDQAAVMCRYCGCSTSGEITPDGMQSEGFLAIALPARWFDCQCLVMNEVASIGMESVAKHTASHVEQFRGALSRAPEPGSLFALNLIDGLSYSEEIVTVAIDRGLDGIPLIGGSAGDDLLFEQTWQISNRACHTRSCILTLVHSRLPVQVYTNNNFVVTEHKLVVTEADPDLRRVSEFNAEPAAEAYARATGLSIDELDAGSFASNALIVQFGGDYYCRSIQSLNEDGSLTFFCAIDNGLVLTVARSQGMVDSSREKIQAIEQDIGPLELLFGFDCIYRKLDARNRQSSQRISAMYQEKNFFGFHTYGEQYGPLHVNQTFTGVAIGAAPDEP